MRNSKHRTGNERRDIVHLFCSYYRCCIPCFRTPRRYGGSQLVVKTMYMCVISFALIQQRCSRARSSQWTTCKPRNSQQQEDRCWSSGVGQGGCSGRKFQLTLWRPRCKLRRGQRRYQGGGSDSGSGGSGGERWQWW
ncbi:hypothetical protein ACFW04_000648 [Cataglyphis niger]